MYVTGASLSRRVYRRLEARGEQLPDVWLRHQPSDAVKLVRLQGVLPEDEASELGRIAKLEGERRNMKLTHSSLCRAVIRAFIIANDKAEAADRPVDSADLFRVQAQ
jgi:transposase